MTDVLKPDLTLLMKLGSIAVHADEMLSPTGHQFDQTVLRLLLADEEIKAWLTNMGEVGPRTREALTRGYRWSRS